MKKLDIGSHAKVERMEWAVLPGTRARAAGSNARLGPHGQSVPHSIVRLTIDGVSGFGWSRVTQEEAQALMSVPVKDMFAEDGTVLPAYRSIEYPLLDWVGHLLHQPVYALFAEQDRPDGDHRVPCYDTSLYFDDLHVSDDRAAVELIQSEAVEGLNRGHRHFKIKVGRGAKHMPLQQGTERDIAMIKGVREIAGPDSRIMIDANNGYNLNLTKEVLRRTAEDRIFWVEEAFHEDPVLYEDLKEWLRENQLQVLIGDGEGLAAEPLVDWAKRGIVDVLQYDILHPGFSFWIRLGRELDKHGVKTAPHNYGSAYGNYVTGHLCPAVQGLLFVEWDEIRVDGLDASNYRIENGEVLIPNQPGFGLTLDGAYFSKKAAAEGWMIQRE